jgi:hypothetical protein
MRSSQRCVFILVSVLALAASTAAIADEGKDESGRGKRHHDRARDAWNDRERHYVHGGYDTDFGWDVYGSYEARHGRVYGSVDSGGPRPYYVLNQEAPCAYEDCYDRYDDDHVRGYRDGRDFEYRHDNGGYDERHYGDPNGYGYAPAYVPRGHLPPPGECKVWIPGLPPGQQGPPTDCHSATHEARYYGGFVVFGGPERH